MIYRWIILLLKIIFFLPGTFLHELAHAGFAWLFGKVVSFNLVPEFHGSRIIYGSVQYGVYYTALAFFVSFAPLLWWVFLIIISLYGFFHSETLGGFLFKLYLGLILLWAGKLSSIDIKVGLKSLMSPSGGFMIGIIAAVLFMIFQNEYVLQKIHQLIGV